MIDDTLRMLGDSARDFAKLDAKRVRALRGQQPSFERAVWGNMAELGWLGICVPEAQGGMGLGIAAAATVAEQLGRAVFPEPYVAAAVLAPRVLALSEKSPLRDKLLAAIASGETLATLAWQGVAGGIEPQATGVKLESGKLSGAARFVPAADGADGFIVAAKSVAGLELHWVSYAGRDTAGLTLKFEEQADGGVSGWLSFDQVATGGCIASGTNAEAALTQGVDEAVIAASAELLGLMSRALEMTLDYLRTRVQFGKPIGSFQALQHRATNIFMLKELTIAALDAALAVVTREGCDAKARAASASSVKARASDAALRICREAVQLHGAIGFTDEYDLALYYNRVLVRAAWLGNATVHRGRFDLLTPLEEMPA